jgi:hypothetical protein
MTTTRIRVARPDDTYTLSSSGGQFQVLGGFLNQVWAPFGPDRSGGAAHRIQRKVIREASAAIGSAIATENLWRHDYNGYTLTSPRRAEI